MALLEGDERSEMPSMSWNSVVKGRSAAGGSRPDDDAEDETGDRGDPPRPSDSSMPPAAFSTQPVHAPPTLTPTASPDPAAPAPVFPGPAPIPAAPAPHVPAAPAPAPALAAPAPVPAPVALPEIVEATPSPAIVTQITEAIAEPTVAVPTVPAASGQASVTPDPSVTTQTTPVIPVATQPNQAISLPAVAAAAPAAARAAAIPANSKPTKQRKDRSGSIARVGFFFLVVGALASAAVIFGRPYLFPADWEDNALDFAEPIEAARGTDFIEPVLLTPQPTAVHRDMVAAQLLGDPASNLAMWRALGLAGSDSTDDATLRTLISELAPVLYSTTDGQVYYDASFTRSDRATLISQAMATAALDQQFSFSTDTPNRSLDDAALTEAHVLQQAAIIAQTATSRAPLPNADMAALAFLPAVLDYQLTAPTVFADLLPPVNEVAPNPLTGLGQGGAGPLNVPPLAQIPSTSLVAGDTVVGSAVVTDRSFWYLSFASHLDASTAYRMSNQLQSAGLQMVDSPAGRCAVATLTTGDATTNAALQADLDAWAAVSAPELGTTVSALPDA
ncbi:MAG: hypothetical protein WA964_13055, partial [Ilumatobacter sp.]